MKPDLLGYVLQMLEPEEERAVEAYLEATPEARREVMRMRPLLSAMQQDDAEPSKDLIFKTLRAVASQRSGEATSHEEIAACTTGSKSQRSSAQLPKLEPWAMKEFESSPTSWRRADAWALIAVVLLILLAIPPVLQFVRDRAGQVECRENMRQLYSSFTEYMNDHGGAIPVLAEKGPGSRAGIYATTLKEAGLWGERMRLGCPPGSSTVPASMAEVQKHTDEELPYWKKFAGSYAYNLGYTKQDDAGKINIMQVKRGDGDGIPILADRPARFGEVPEWATANSPNHGGQGQNVLCLGGSASFVKSRCALQGDPDIYRNQQGQPYCGKTAFDAVLGPSEARPIPTPAPND